jgi:hypothetical protein
MAKKIIIHIGPAKTGTSSLQEALFQSRETLLQHGYDFPGFGRHEKMPLLPGHHGIPDRLRRAEEVPAGVLENLALINDDRTLVFSSENFAHVSQKAVQILADSLGTEDIAVVYYVRRWDHLLPSVWQELVKHGDSRPYLEFLNAQTSAPLASPYLNYTSVLDNWSKVLGLRNIRIFSYDNIKDSGQGIVEHFYSQVLDVPFEAEVEQRENPRQTIEYTETVRILNRMTFGSKNGTPEIRMALAQAKPDLAEELAALDKLYAKHKRQARICAPFVFRQVERAFLRTYEACVENLSDNDRLFGDFQMEPTSYISQDYLLEPHALDKLQALLKKIRKRAA